MRILCFFFIIFAKTSCGRVEGLTDSNKKRFDDTSHEKNKIKSLIQQGRRTCLLGNFSSCSFRSHKFESAQPLKESLGQRILIIDHERTPAFTSGFFRNKGRILNLYQLNSDLSGELEPFYPLIYAPRVLDSIFQGIRFLEEQGETMESFDPDLFTLLKLHHKIKILRPLQKEIPHGEFVFDLLAKLNPKAQFVIAPFPELPEKEFCRMSQNFSKIELFFQNAAQVYLDLIRHYQINYVNLSYASTYSSLSAHNKRLCSGRLTPDDLKKYLGFKTNFLDLLSRGSVSSVFFQAVPNEYEKSYFKNKASSSFCCKKRKNFIAVGYWSRSIVDTYKVSNIKLKQYLPLAQRKLWPCVDLYVNSGFDEFPLASSDRGQRNVLSLMYHGIYPSSSFDMSSSFAVPVALSHFNYVKRNRINYLLRGDFLAQKVIDPILTGEFLNSGDSL